MRYLIITISLLFATQLFAQDDKKTLGSITLSKLGVGFEIPSGDMSDRFGRNMNFQLGIDHIMSNNWYMSGWFTYRFGDQVKEDVLAHFRHQSGDFLAPDGQTAIVLLRQRGAALGLTGGKIIPMGKPTTHSGIRIGVGVHYASHYIRIQDENNAINQVLDPYKKGYDRLTRGFGISQEIGYQYLSTDGLLNLYAGLELNQSFTSSVRSIDFTTNTNNSGSRTDILSGVRVAMFIPIFRGSQEAEDIYY